MTNRKPRIIKDYDKLSDNLIEQIKLLYPTGYTNNLIVYTDREGKFISALPFETEDAYYLIKMTKFEATRIVEDDDDFDDAGFLKEAAKEAYEDKYNDVEDDEEDDDGYDTISVDDIDADEDE